MTKMKKNDQEGNKMMEKANGQFGHSSEFVFKAAQKGRERFPSYGLKNLSRAGIGLLN